MAVISKQRYRFDGGDWYRVTRCDTHGEFSIALPSEVAGTLGFSEVRAKTLNEIESKWRDTLKRYEAARTTKRKVICYLFSFIQAGDKEQSGFGLGMSVWAEVFTEIRVKSGAHENIKYEAIQEDALIPTDLFCDGNFDDPMRDLCGQSFSENRRSGGTDGRRGVLDWTPEREAFFAELVRGMRKMMDRVQEFTASREAVAGIADSKSRLLPGG